MKDLEQIGKDFPNFPMKGSPASLIHDVTILRSLLESYLYDRVNLIFGWDGDEDNIDGLICEDISTDWYDNSIELLNCSESVKEATPEQVKAVLALGFDRFWLNWGEKYSKNHKDKYYCA